MNPPRTQLLLVEDDTALTTLIVDELESEGWHLATAATLAEARSWLAEHRVAVVICDLRLPDGNGMQLIEELVGTREDALRPGLVVITAFGSVRQAVAALQAGADDFLTKPLDLDHFRIAISRVLETQQLKAELRRFRHFIGNDNEFHGLFGKSTAMLRLCEQVRTVARADGPVLILGESGTGKELVAQAIHAESERAEGPFLAVNCAGIPRELLESEFFGHARGAFSGAEKARKGLLQEAHGGTLMLDEIGEMPQALQAKLLRALQDGSIRPVGQDTEERVDVRIIAATHQDLSKKVADGSFREDLYYRLETFTLPVPPLREREEDVVLLARRFLQEFALRQDKHIQDLSPDALRLLAPYPFPGNVRELRNVIERAVAYCQGSRITAQDLPDRLRAAQPDSGGDGPSAKSEDEQYLIQGNILPTLDELQKRYARLVLQRVDGNKQRAAALLGIGRRTLYRWLDEPTAQEDN